MPYWQEKHFLTRFIAASPAHREQTKALLYPYIMLYITRSNETFRMLAIPCIACGADAISRNVYPAGNNADAISH
jgi:hypothetical protein